MIDWTQVILAAIGAATSVLSVVFSRRAAGHATQAAVSADRAVQASLRPPPSEQDAVPTPREGSARFRSAVKMIEKP